MQAFVCQRFDEHSHDVQAEVYLNPCIILRLPNQLHRHNANIRNAILCAHTWDVNCWCRLLVPSAIRGKFIETQSDASSHCVEAVSTAGLLEAAEPQFASLCCSADERAAGLD